MHLGGTEKSLHVQNTEGVHLSLSPKFGTMSNRAFREGVHLEGVHLEGFLCMIYICVTYTLALQWITAPLQQLAQIYKYFIRKVQSIAFIKM